MNPIHNKLIQSQDEALSYLKSLYDFYVIETKRSKENESQITILEQTIASNKDTITSLLHELNSVKQENLFLKSQLNPSYHFSTLPTASPPKIISQLETIITISNIHSDYLMSPILLIDNRLATCSLDCSIRILSIDFTNRTYTIDINKQNAHSSPICSICELSNNRLASSSYDHSIKIWSIDKKALSLVQTLTRHIHQVFRVISLEHNVFASCSFDRTVRLWNEVTYQELTVLQHNRSVNYLLQLKKRDILVTSCFNSCLCCWDVTKCTKVSEIHGIYTYANSHMIEVGDGLVAVSAASFQDSIVIVPSVESCGCGLGPSPVRLG